MKYQIKIVKPRNSAIPPSFCPYMIDGADAPK